MPVAGADLFSVVFAYIVMLVLPIVGIVVISLDMIQRKAFFILCASLVAYPLIIILWHLVVGYGVNIFGAGMLFYYLSLLIIIVAALLAVLWIRKLAFDGR